MRPRIVILIFFLIAGLAFQKQSTGGGREKVWILFKERSPGLASTRITSLSRVAIHRRLNRAETPFDESDLPVEKKYVDAVRQAGATVLVESRWIHGVSALCEEHCRKSVVTLPFVKELRPVLKYYRKSDTVKPILQTSTDTTSKGFKYGESKNQLDQIGVPTLHKKGFAGQGEIVAVFDSGFRKDHIAFKNQVIIAERDFVFNDTNVTNGGNTDSHGTSTWSCVGGEAPGTLYGPAYRAGFILAATEDIRSETVVEEDHWVAAFEWADEMGATVINSSLGYSDWYTQFDYDGETAITSKVVKTAAKKGIVVVTSVGNSGPGDSTLSAPADGKRIITVGAVDLNGLIADFSSRGPTADGRLKPEVVARGVSTFVATSFSNDTFGRSNGTSFSCPLVAGTAASLLSAHPDWKPLQVREALMMTASQASVPDNTYGWGIVNLSAAYDYLPRKSVVIDEHRPLKNTTNTSKPYRVRARIRAERGIDPDKLFLFWKREGASKFLQVSFSPVANKPDFFDAFIPPQARGSTVLYYLTARDLRGRRSKYPMVAPAVPLSFQIL